MVPIWIIVGLVISGMSISALGAYFSIIGIGALFSGALLSVWAMAGSLELAKFVLAAYLHRKWSELNTFFKYYLTGSVVVLSLITSMGIFGFLSDAYQSASTVLQAETIKLQNLQTQVERAKSEIERLNKSIEEIPANRITRRIQARAQIEPRILELNKSIDGLNNQVSGAELIILEVKKKVGPLIYISRTFNVDIDIVVKYLILIFVLVFDPLAISIVVAISESLQSRSKKQSENQNEYSQTKNLDQKNNPPIQNEEIIQMRFSDDADQNAV